MFRGIFYKLNNTFKRDHSIRGRKMNTGRRLYGDQEEKRKVKYCRKDGVRVTQ